MTVPVRRNNIRRAFQKVMQASKRSGITIRRRRTNLDEDDDELFCKETLGAVSTDGENEDDDENDSSSSSTSSSAVTVGSVPRGGTSSSSSSSTSPYQQQQRSPTVVQFEDKLKVYVYYVESMSHEEKEQLYYSKAERAIMEQQLRKDVFLLRSGMHIQQSPTTTTDTTNDNNNTNIDDSSIDIPFTPLLPVTRFPSPNPLSPTINTTANTNTFTTDRGVEHYINLELQDEIKVRQKMVVRAVLTEQAYQRESNIYDPEAIRTFYMEISKLSKGLAFQLAHNTEETEMNDSTNSSLLEL